MPYYVTTPIYYVNGEPHLGHAYTTIAADVLARHMRQRGEEVFFLTGTDEHGEPVSQEAERRGITPRELGDQNAVRFKELAARLNATNDFFIRTTDPEHMAKVAEVVQRSHENGHVYAGHYEGWYCPRCADFKTEAELEDGNRCPIHKVVLEIEKEDNWFFRLSAFQEPLEKLYADRPDFVTPQNRYNEALSFIKGGLRDLSLSRARLKWGVPVPWDESQVIYVWIDALLNYYTALSYARPGEDLTDRFWPALHLLGKDILKFHAVIWPALLMAADLEVPRKVAIHGYLLLGEHKMSKSLGNVIEPFQVADAYGPDARDGRPLPRRRRAERRARSGACRGLRRSGRRGARAYRRGRAHGGARRDLAADQAAQPVRDGRGALAAGEGRHERRCARRRAVLACGGAPRRVGAAPPVHAGLGGAAARCDRPARSVARWGRARRRRRPREGRRAGAALPARRGRGAGRLRPMP